MCLAKKVLVNPTRSAIGLLVASAHQLVNSKLLDVCFFARLAAAHLADVGVAGGVAVVLRLRAVADDEQLHVAEQAGVGPEAVALVAVDLVERLADRHAPTLQLHVHQRQTVDQHRDVVAVRAGSRRFVLVDDLEPIVVDVLLVDQVDVLDCAVVTLQHLDVVFLDAGSLLDDAVIPAGNLLGEEPLPLGDRRTRSGSLSPAGRAGWRPAPPHR